MAIAERDEDTAAALMQHHVEGMRAVLDQALAHRRPEKPGGETI